MQTKTLVLSCWMCPFCEWKTPYLPGGLDVGLVVAHLDRKHEEIGLIPNELVKMSQLRHWRCPNCAAAIAWDYDGIPDGCGDNKSFEGPDYGLKFIIEHTRNNHPEVIFGDLVPIGELTRLKRV